MPYSTLNQHEIKNKVVFLRADLNVPFNAAGRVSDTSRLKAIEPTLMKLVKGGAKVVLASHLGRPKGKEDPNLSMKKVLPALKEVYPSVSFVFSEDLTPKDWGSEAQKLDAGTVLLTENLRFFSGEEKNSDAFAQELAVGVDLYVNDAFACSHRAHASVVAITKHLPSVMGELFLHEISCLEKLLKKPKRPMMALIGGAKISTKLTLLRSLMQKADHLVVVGAMANTLYYAMGLSVGRSLVEESLSDEAKSFLRAARDHACEVYIPQDVVVTKEISETSEKRVCVASDVGPDDIIVDAGPVSIAAIKEILDDCKTVVWNGALGIAEIDQFSTGTTEIATYIAGKKGKSFTSVAGGGDTLALLKKAHAENGFTYLSTAGGAFLEWLEGKKLPGLEALKN